MIIKFLPSDHVLRKRKGKGIGCPWTWIPPR